jgi:hypothetical protein
MALPRSTDIAFNNEETHRTPEMSFCRVGL